MKHKIPILKIFLPFFLFFTQADAGYREQFQDQWARKDFPAMEKTLSDWKKSNPQDFERLVASGNYFYRKGQSGRGRPYLLKALDSWQAALKADPWRLDVCFNLAQLYQDLGDFEAQYGFLAQTLKSADKGWRNLRWVDGQKLPKRSSRIIPEALQGYIAHYFGQNTREGDEKALRLARLAITFYPNRPAAYNSISTYFSRRQDWPRALKYLLIANQKDPKDSHTLCHIGNTLVRLGKRKEAGIFYRKVVKLNRDPESMATARNYLRRNNL